MQDLILLGDFNHPDNCGKSSMESFSQFRRLLECTEDNFQSQVIDALTRGDAILNLLLTKANELMGRIRTGGCLGCSDRALTEEGCETSKR